MSAIESPIWLPIYKDFFPDLEVSKPRLIYQETLEKLERMPELLGGPILDRQMAGCCVGALWLKADFFEQAHKLFQDVHTSTGALWHGISHRREGDHGNASYWFARCPNHPASKETPLFQNDKQPNNENRDKVWNYDAFNRQVKNRGKASENFDEMIRLQETEWQRTFLWTLKKALSKIPAIF